MPLIATSPTSRRVGGALGLLALIAVLLLLVGLPGGALHAQAAHANSTQLSIMMDDDQLVYRNDKTRDRTLARMKALGVDYVRVTLLWSVVANGATASRHFRATQPNTYPLENWDRYDGVVRTAKRLGLGVYFDITGPGPSWSHARPPRADARDAATWRPSARAFYDFVVAVGKRYSGHYRARNHQILPRVTTWSLWNEPNQGGWLTPQWAYSPSLHRVEPASPAIYRDLYLYGRRALDATGHGRDFIMAGETAPLGSNGHSDRSPIAPKAFIRELLCMAPNGRAYTGRAAAARGCGSFARLGPLRTSAWAHHPYTKYLPPNQPDANRDAITMANIGDLPVLLDQAAHATHHIAANVPVMSTEFGYETNPPDPFVGIALDKQAAYINEGDYEAYLNPRVLGNTQFLLTDAAPLTQYPRNSRRYWFTYQSGLQFLGGRPKPSLAAYLLPFVTTGPYGDAPSGRLYGVWGQLRFRPHPLAPRTPPDYVGVEFLASGSHDWTPLGVPIRVTNPLGFFTALVAVPGGGQLRIHYPGSPQRYSRTVAVQG